MFFKKSEKDKNIESAKWGYNHAIKDIESNIPAIASMIGVSEKTASEDILEDYKRKVAKDTVKAVLSLLKVKKEQLQDQIEKIK